MTAPKARLDGRRPDEMRRVNVTRGFTRTPPGSILIEMGRTKVLCTAMIEHSVPPWMVNKGRGWLTAEYGMLPGSTQERKPRERAKPDGRTTEIQRLIGRSLRGAVDLELLGERTLWVDCDVLEADGGTRTAAITGAYIAVGEAIKKLEADGVRFGRSPLRDPVAAVSVGLLGGHPHIDLCYEEDVRAEVDMNVVMNFAGKFIEVQGTGEHGVFSRDDLAKLLDLAERGARQLFEIQKQALTK